MVRGLAIALEVIPSQPLELGDGLRCTGLQGARNGRLLGTARAPKGPLHRGVDANHDITLRDGLGATEEPQQPIEHFVNRTIADHFLWYLGLFPQRGKETVPL